jgi:AcrR family transcriptional regulator
MARLRREQQVERNREAVLAAARRVFLAKGYAGATLDAIAEEAGFSTGVIYSQFGSKADLLLTLLERRIDERAAEHQRIAAELPGAEGIRALLVAETMDLAANQEWARLLVEFRTLAARDPALNRRYAEAHARTVHALASVLEWLHQQAGLQPAVAPRSMATVLLAVRSGLLMEQLASPAALHLDDVMALMSRSLGLPDPTEPEPPQLRHQPAQRPSNVAADATAPGGTR